MIRVAPTPGYRWYRPLDRDHLTPWPIWLLAYAASLMVRPQLADDDHAETTLEHALHLMDFDPAAYWTPGMAFFERLKKPQMSEVADTVIGATLAHGIADAKKAGMALKLGDAFVPDQDQRSRFDQETREQIQAWTPTCMKTRPDDKTDKSVGN